MDDPQPVARTDDEFQAEAMCDALRARGLRCNQARVPDIRGVGALLGAGGADLFEVYVDASDVADAKAFLSAPGTADDDSSFANAVIRD